MRLLWMLCAWAVLCVATCMDLNKITTRNRLSEKRGTRQKREIIYSCNCPEGMVKLVECIPCALYLEITEEDECPKSAC